MKLYCKFISGDVSPHEEWRRLLYEIFPDCGEIARTPEGKPYFPDAPEVSFSVSHSKGLVVIAAGTGSVGVDCELIGPVRVHAARRAFTEEELLYADTPERFYEVWTRKEAYFKFLGTGITEKFPFFNSLSSPDIYSFSFHGYVISVCDKNSNECEIISISS